LHLQQVAKSDENLIPAILECARAEVTVGEIADALREIFGEHRDADPGGP
jgi:methylmalonyl-CoA mutase N-terminal domain/subunit